ncbi:hypothetical protein Q73A0000_05670 [Kaistella flava (ex Peng et al. 2021)]|uniref:Uncharacterized protein n=1 Tax=Kaistella flava (ex Peng et al. 2021) TaxID=2038776 RepID=A0A7M2Y721_9FLAO|nr:hypothetical protein [Kaistella flava (ex Peng et al. 2021)]QOW09886.1 hypothetical protein Q73A0000_05670 [Kaistella flava (ex Peng et al. 2021)]
MKKLLIISFLFIHILSYSQEYKSIKNIFGKSCSDENYKEYINIKKLYLKQLRSDSSLVIYRNSYNSFFLKDKLDSIAISEGIKNINKIEFNNMEQRYRYQYFLKYNNFKIYGNSPSTSAKVLYYLEIFKNDKRLETVHFYGNEDISIEISPDGRYKRTEMYSGNPRKCSYYTQDTLMSNVFVGESLFYDGEKSRYTDWDKEFTVTDEKLLKILPQLFLQAIQIQQDKVKNLKGKDIGSGYIVTNEDIDVALKYLDELLITFQKDIKNNKKNIEFEKLFSEKRQPIWTVEYGIGLVISGKSGKLINVNGFKTIQD